VKEEPLRIDAAIAKYLGARAAEATITKLITVFEKQFLASTNDNGLRYLKERAAFATKDGVRNFDLSGGHSVATRCEQDMR
jgi:hypothetical protein